MERAAEARKRPNFYICLGLILLLAFVSITLILAKGLDSNRFIRGVTWVLAGLPISLTVPVFVGFDFFERTYHADNPISFCPIAPKGAENARKFSFLLAVAGTLLTIILFFVYNGNEAIEPMKACLIYLIPTLPVLALYLIPLIPACFKEGREGDGAILVAVMTAAVAAAGLVVFGMMKKETTYLVSYIAYPLCACFLMLYKRGD